MPDTSKFDVAVVGGGLAGLSAAAYLAKNNKRVALVDRGKLGGRAVSMNIKGFTFNFGAHAIYGRDTSVLRKLEDELGIRIHWRDFTPSKAKYDIGDEMTDIPANVVGLYRTKVMKRASSKIIFVFNILKTMLHIESGHPHLSIDAWMERKAVNPDVRRMMMTLASSNFFTREPNRIPSDVFFNYYKRIFTTNKPVAYIEGGWQSLIDEFTRVIEENEGTILSKRRVVKVAVDGDHVTSVASADQQFMADEFLFCIPPKEMVSLFTDSKIEHFIRQYATYQPAYVLVYDIGLNNRIDKPYTYVYDRKNQMFITDISYYDPTCVPEGGQLLQAIAYLRADQTEDKETVERFKGLVEALYDKHFAGWRDCIVTQRVSHKAVAQEIKWVMNQQPMPNFFPDYRNLYFAGDWCDGQGQLSELSFSSARRACEIIMQK